MTEHHLGTERLHDMWDNSLPPTLEIESGDIVTCECLDAAGGAITPDTPEGNHIPPKSWRGHPLTGPIAVRGARPGDLLEVEILDLQHHGWGFTSCRPEAGLLDGFGPRLKIWRLGDDFAEFKPGIRIPLMPFCGVMGLAPAEPGEHRTSPPRSVGGNLDIRHLTKGARLYLPVQVPGALFSVGDCHAAQGDGEVCVTAIEAPMTVKLRFTLHRDRPQDGPTFYTPGPLTRAHERGYFCTTGIGPDLFKAAQQAVLAMMGHLQREHGLEEVEAYMLCSVAVDLKISEVVNRPNWVVSAYLPLGIFTQPE